MTEPTKELKSIKIGAVKYKLESKPMPPDDISEIDLMCNTIYVAEGLPINQEQLAILHESWHAINWKIPEEVIEYMAQATYSLIKQNPEFIKQILDDKS